MPRNVRNWWIEARCDGRQEPVAFGPKSAGGGFSMTVYQRNMGEVEKALELWGHYVNGVLVLELSGPALPDGDQPFLSERNHEYRTRRQS